MPSTYLSEALKKQKKEEQESPTTSLPSFLLLLRELKKGLEGKGEREKRGERERKGRKRDLGPRESQGERMALRGRGEEVKGGCCIHLCCAVGGVDNLVKNKKKEKERKRKRKKRRKRKQTWVPLNQE